jgi:hypothetical protein
LLLFILLLHASYCLNRPYFYISSAFYCSCYISHFLLFSFFTLLILRVSPQYPDTFFSRLTSALHLSTSLLPMWAEWASLYSRNTARHLPAVKCITALSGSSLLHQTQFTSNFLLFVTSCKCNIQRDTLFHDMDSVLNRVMALQEGISIPTRATDGIGTAVSR